MTALEAGQGKEGEEKAAAQRASLSSHLLGHTGSMEAERRMAGGGEH